MNVGAANPQGITGTRKRKEFLLSVGWSSWWGVVIRSTAPVDWVCLATEVVTVLRQAGGERRGSQ